ncbi:MAG: hypothetical protein ACYTXE_35050 [Nostoc sp.]
MTSLQSLDKQLRELADRIKTHSENLEADKAAYERIQQAKQKSPILPVETQTETLTNKISSPPITQEEILKMVKLGHSTDSILARLQGE